MYSLFFKKNPDFELLIEKNIEVHDEKEEKIVAIEELSELQKELTKDLRGKLDKYHMAEEMADAMIMLFQLMKIYENEELVEDFITNKSERIMKNIREKCEEEVACETIKDWFEEAMDRKCSWCDLYDECYK